MSAENPSAEVPPEPNGTPVPEPSRKPRARWKMLLAIGVLGALSVLAEFLIPRMMMLAEVERGEWNRKDPQPPVLKKEDLPWTTQTVSIIQPADGPSVAVLSRAKRPEACPPVLNAQSVLAHEIARQAILCCLREDFGLRTCDQALGASAPEGKTRAELSMSTLVRDNNSVFVMKLKHDGKELISESFKLKTKGPEQPPFKQPLHLAPPSFRGYVFPYEDLARQAVEQARGPWIKAFGTLGLKVKPARGDSKSEEALDRSITGSLDIWTFPKPFGAVERLHAEAASKGLSPARLSGLSFGYAQLGYLSGHLWTSIHDTFSARGLIYAQRLVNQDPESPVGLWYRAYSLALAGLHQDALDDLRAAEKLRDALPEADRPGPPKWVGTVEAFCRFDSERLDQIALTGSASERTRARILGAWIKYDPILRQDQGALAAQAAIKAEPECYRVYSDYYDTAGDVGDRHKSTGLPLAVFSARVPYRLKTMAGLPEPVRSVLESESQEMDVVKAIEDEARAHPSGAELPWAALARWMREERFLQVLRRTEFMVKQWSVPVDDFIQQYGPLVEDHPFRLAVDALYREPSPEAYEQFHADDPLAVEGPVFLLMIKKQKKDQQKLGDSLFGVAFTGTDDTYDSLVRMARFSSQAGEMVAGVRLMAVSPYSPVGPATVIENQGLKPGQAEEWLTSHAHHPMVMQMLGMYFEERHDLENAAKSYEAVISRSHDTFAYEKLAGIYKSRGRRDEWKRTLDEALKNTPNQGLKHARMQADIAQDLMAHGQAEAARPYADAAAETWAAWAMRCAVDCHTVLEEWDEADLWVSRLSERYSSHLFDWYYWCLKNGHGHVVDAQTFTIDAIDSMDLAHSSDPVRGTAIYYCNLAHEYEKAVKILEIDFPKPSLYLQGLYLGLCADELGDRETRSRGWSGIPEGDASVSGLANLFLSAVEKDERGSLDLDAVDALLKDAPARRQGDLCYFIGRFLQRRGQSEDASRFLEQVRDNPSATGYMKLAAECALREGG